MACLSVTRLHGYTVTRLHGYTYGLCVTVRCSDRSHCTCRIDKECVEYTSVKMRRNLASSVGTLVQSPPSCSYAVTPPRSLDDPMAWKACCASCFGISRPLANFWSQAAQLQRDCCRAWEFDRARSQMLRPSQPSVWRFLICKLPHLALPHMHSWRVRICG